ncbi:MAG: YihY/virulence factor BrkB family protein, partial [Puniceicoccales bacterium]|nr:YihY/virulence factor BrkB family protein [Puniceicoccales bacterium]
MSDATEQPTGPEKDIPEKPVRPSITQRFFDFNEKIWRLESLNDRSLKGKLTALYRVVSITIKGVLQNKIPMQSAALTYYSLMSLGPLLALALIISSFVLKREDGQGDDKLKAAIVWVIHEVVPQTTIETDSDYSEEELAMFGLEQPESQLPKASLKDINADIDKLIDKLLKEAASGTAGVVGLVILIVLAVLMISRVENTFNSIWNVQYGRSWKDRFVNYFMFTVLFFLLGAASLTMVSASSFAKGLAKSGASSEGLSTYLEAFPSWLVSFLQSSAPVVISILLVTLLTASLNKFIPNVRVKWAAALGGGFVAALIIIGNQKLAALYVSKVISFKNLYGELGIIFILMFGLYLTWLFLLIGGQVTYAFQNVRFLADHRTWESLSMRAKQTLCFACLLVIARRFKEEKTAPTSEELM